MTLPDFAALLFDHPTASSSGAAFLFGGTLGYMFGRRRVARLRPLPVERIDPRF